MKMRQAAVVLIVLLSLILSACGGPAASTAVPTTAPTTAPAPTTDTAAPTADTAAPTTDTGAQTSALPEVVKLPAQIAGGRPVKITIVGMPPEAQPESQQAWKDQAARFMAKYPNVTVEGSDYAYSPESFPALVAGKQVPTLFEVYLSDPQKIIDQGVAADLTALFDQHGLKSVFNPNILAITSKGQQVFGIPKDAYAMGLAYNIQMLKDAGFSAPPTTWEEAATMAQKLTKRDEGVAGLSFITDGGGATGWQFTTIAYTFGATPADIVAAKGADGFTAGFGTGKPVDTLNFVQELRWKYDVLPRENLDWPKNGEVLATERAAMVIMAGDQFGWIKSTFPDVDITKFGYAPLPAGPGGKSVSLVGGTIAMISSAATADEQEAAAYYRLWQQFDPAEILAGYEAAKKDPLIPVGAPLLPMYVGDYQAKAAELRKQYANLPVENYKPFVDAVTSGAVGLQPEPAPAGQEYYSAMGAVVSTILTNESADPAAEVAKSAETFQSNVLDALKQ